jgi:hypothetical protein
MVVAEEASILERRENGSPLKIKVVDDAAGTAIYTVRYDKPIKRPTKRMELVYDDFHPDTVRLDTENGATKLRGDKGLPDSCVILINLGNAKASGGVPSHAYPAAPVGTRAFGKPITNTIPVKFDGAP